jgi:hypothetical protein
MDRRGSAAKRFTMRAPVVLMLLAACGLAGCGSSRSATQTSATSSSATINHSKVAGTPVTKIRAVAFAHSVNLRASDVPGLNATSPEKVTTPRGTQTSFSQCPSLGIIGIASVDSPTFSAAQTLREELHSTVRVMNSARDAATEVAAYQGSRGVACLTQVAHKTLLSPRTLERFPQSTLKLTPLLVPTFLRGGQGWRSTIMFRPVRNGSLTMYQDVIVFASGPAEIELYAQGTKRLTAATERALLLRLLTRATANAL